MPKRPTPQQGNTHTRTATALRAAKKVTGKRDDLAHLRSLLGWPAHLPLVDLPHGIPPRGLRLVIEAERGIDIATLTRHLRQVYGTVQVEKSFPHYQPGIDIPCLQDYHFVTLPGLDADRLLANPFDIAYAAIKKGLVKGAEPEPPSAEFSPHCHDRFAEHHDDHRWSLKAMNVPAAWDRLQSAGKNLGGGIRIGHPDTGVTFHARMLGSYDLAASVDFVRQTSPAIDPLPPRGDINWRLEVPGHGTMTSSVILARDPSTPPTQMAGIAPDATVVPTRVTRSVALSFFGHLAQGLDHAWQNSCRVVSVSLAGVTGSITHAALRNCDSRGLLVCCAAGNCVPYVLAPAVHKEAIACGGTRLRDHGNGPSEAFWSPSADGPISIAAPAELVWVCEAATATAGPARAGTPDDPFDGVSDEEGTSFAAAAVAAIAALWLKFHEDKDLLGRYHRRRPLSDVFKEILRNTARRPSHWRAHGWGPGIIDAAAILDAPLPDAGPLHANVDYLLQFDQPDDLDLWYRLFWDLPQDAVRRMLMRLLRVIDEAELRQHLHAVNLELTWLLRNDARHFHDLRNAVAAEADNAADQVAAAAANLAQRASNKLRSMLP